MTSYRCIGSHEYTLFHSIKHQYLSKLYPYLQAPHTLKVSCGVLVCAPMPVGGQICFVCKICKLFVNPSIQGKFHLRRKSSDEDGFIPDLHGGVHVHLGTIWFHHGHKEGECFVE